MSAMSQPCCARGAPVVLQCDACARPDAGALGLPAPVASYQYVQPRGKYWLRMSLEEIALLGLGEADYQLSHPSVHFTLPFTWTTVWEKMTWQHLGFDTLSMENDQLAHPGAGTLVYQFARANGFNIAASAVVTVASSVLWKQFGELRQSNFLNSIITTSIAGVAIGEAGLQLGAFFDAGRSTPLTETLSLLVAPVRKVHDWIDGARSVRTTNTDALGLSRDIGHTIRLSSGILVTRLSSSERLDQTFVDVAGTLRTHIVNVPGYDDPGIESRWWDDGNESDLAGDLQLGQHGVSDVYLVARVAPVGWFTKAIAGNGDGRRGQRFWIGPTVGFDYAVHDYDRVESIPKDRFSTSQLGLEFEQDVFFPHGQLRTALAIHGRFGPVHALALDRSLALGVNPALLPEVARMQGTYWSWGLGAAPTVELRLGPVRTGASARLDAFWGTYVLQSPTAGEVTLRDWASVTDVWLGCLPLPALELAVDGRWRTRSGSVGGTHENREEKSILTVVGVVF